MDIEELHCRGNVYDSLVITKNEDYVMRRLQKNEYNVLNILEQPIKEPLSNINIELFEGDNYIYLLDMVGNKLYAEYLVKSDFTDLYVTKNEMNSAINETAGEIELTVNQKLTEYATSEDLEEAVTELNGTITTKAGEINLEVSKKVNDSELTGANIALRINNDTSEAQIKASKININGVVTANNTFKINLDGTMETKGGTIGGWTINENGLTNGKVFLNKDGSSTVYTVADLIVIRNYIMGISGFELPPNMVKHYDLDGDGKVTAMDYTTLQNLIGISMN